MLSRSGEIVPEPDLFNESCEVTGGGTVAVTRNVVLADAAPSPTVIVTSEKPPEPDVGVMVTVRFEEPPPPNTMLASGTIAGPDETAVTESKEADVSTSPIVNERGPLFVSETIVMLEIGVIVGALFTDVTVTPNVRVVVLLTPWLSLTVTVIVAVPLALATGVKLKLPVAFGLV